MFKEYNKRIDKIILGEGKNLNWKKTLEYHQKMLLRIQHERMIHLLVTIFVGLIMSIASFVIIVTQKIDLIIFVAFLFVLFIAYLSHYYFLENTTQKWYKTEDEIVSRL